MEATPQRLQAGDKLEAIYWPSGEEIHFAKEIPGYPNVEVIEIVVYMESGQMGDVPWARVTMRNGSKGRYNLAMVEGYDRLDESTTKGDELCHQS